MSSNSNIHSVISEDAIIVNINNWFSNIKHNVHIIYCQDINKDWLTQKNDIPKHLKILHVKDVHVMFKLSPIRKDFFQDARS